MNEMNTCNMQHVHEILGSTLIAERCEDPHNHRFATVSLSLIHISSAVYYRKPVSPHSVLHHIMRQFQYS